MLRFIRKTTLLSLAAVIGLCVPVAANNLESTNSGVGILSARSQSPAHSLRMVMSLIPAQPVRPGWGAEVGATWTNVWATGSEYYLDYEMLEKRAALTYTHKNTTIGLALDDRNYFGGGLDRFIQNFHDAFDIDQSGRKDVDTNLSRVGWVGENGYVESPASGLNNQGVYFRLTQHIPAQDSLSPDLNLSIACRYAIETGDVFVDEHPFDFGVSLGLSKRLTESLYAHIIASHTTFDLTEGVASGGSESIRFAKDQFGVFAALGYELSQNTALLFQYMGYEAAVRGIEKLAENSHEVHVGIKWRTDSHGSIEFALIENILHMDNSPDFGIHFGWSF